MKRDYTIIWYESLDSTNAEAARHMTDIDNLSVIAAKWQSAGRGQRGNTWSSACGENLTFSAVLKFDGVLLPQIRATEQFAVSQAVALATVHYLALKGTRASIKWPNDIYCADRKICGILIENSLMEGRLLTSIAGIGINLNQSSFPAGIPNPTSLALEQGGNYAPEEELPLFLGCLDECLTKLDGRAAEINAEYLNKLYRKDEPHLYTDTATGSQFQGTIRGIGELGTLLLELPSGALKEFSFKEIAYVI